MVCLTGCKSCFPNLANAFCLRGWRGRTLKLLCLLTRFLNYNKLIDLLYWYQFSLICFKWVFLMLCQQILQGGRGSGQHVSIKLQCSSTLVNKKLHPIVRAHYVRKIKRLVHGEMWSKRGLILCRFFFRGALLVICETEIKSFLNALLK